MRRSPQLSTWARQGDGAAKAYMLCTSHTELAAHHGWLQKRIPSLGHDLGWMGTAYSVLSGCRCHSPSQLQCPPTLTNSNSFISLLLFPSSAPPLYPPPSDVLFCARSRTATPGGPATCQSAWVAETVAYCKQHGFRLDFLSSLLRPPRSGPGRKEQIRRETRSEKHEGGRDGVTEIERQRQQLAASEVPVIRTRGNNQIR